MSKPLVRCLGLVLNAHVPALPPQDEDDATVAAWEEVDVIMCV